MTDVIELLTILDNVIGSHRSQGRNEYLFFCPFCSHHKPKLAVNVETGRWHCWVCDSRGRSLFSLLKKANAPRSRIKQVAKLLQQNIQFATAEEPIKDLVLPTEFHPLWKSTRDYEAKHAIMYLQSRRITMSDVIKHNIGYCPTGDYAYRLIIPSYDEEGKLNFFTGRSYRESNFPYKNPVGSKNVVGFESLISWDFPITICEGPMDAIAIRRNAIPLFGKTLPEALMEKMKIYDVTEVYLALDQDALKNALRIAQTLMKEDVNVHVVEMDGRDPSDLGFSGIQRKIQSANEKLTLGDWVSTRFYPPSK